MAHELNIPISFIIGNVHALQRYASRLESHLQCVRGGAQSAELSTIRQALRIDRIVEDLAPRIEGTIEGVERTRDVVDRLKRFSAVDRNESQAFDLKDVIERAVHRVGKAAARPLEVNMTLPDSVPLLGSSGQMQQVVMNLVQNALDATLGRPSPRLDIAANPGGRKIEVVFHDNGPGIEPQNFAQIFDPFLLPSLSAPALASDWRSLTEPSSATAGNSRRRTPPRRRDFQADIAAPFQIGPRIRGSGVEITQVSFDLSQQGRTSRCVPQIGTRA